MKIVIPNLPFSHFQHIAGCLKIIESTHPLEVLLWNADNKPLIDVFDEIKPDIIFLHEKQLDLSFQMVCNEFDFKYVLMGSSPPKEIDKKPSAIITEEEFLENFCIGDNALPLRAAANVSQIQNSDFKEELASEVLVITGLFQMTQAIVESIVFLCDAFKTKIIGDEKFALPNYLGRVDIFERADFIKSSQVLVDFGTQDFLDASCLGTASIVASSSFVPCVRSFNSIDSLRQNINDLLSDKIIYQEYCDKGRALVSQEHTYFHRSASVFSAIGEPEISQTLLNKIEEIVK